MGGLWGSVRCLGHTDRALARGVRLWVVETSEINDRSAPGPTTLSQKSLEVLRRYSHAPSGQIVAVQTVLEGRYSSEAELVLLAMANLSK